MDNKQDILHLLRQVSEGTVAPEDALLQLKEAPFEDLGYAKVDFHRSVRQGAAEVIYGASKTPEQIAGIAKAMGEKGCRNVLITRISQETADWVGEKIPLTYHPLPRLAIAYPADHPSRGNIVVATGGTSDMGVAEEAALTAEMMGNRVTRLYDVGVAGLHRLLSNLDVLMSARCVVAVAGMEGALASRDRWPCGLSCHRGPHQCGVWRQFRRTLRSALHAQFMCVGLQRGQYRQRIRRRIPGQPNQSNGRD